MGHPDGAHTHGSGGGNPVLVVLAVLAVAVVAGPVVAAAAELVHILLIAVVVILAVGATVLVAYVAWRLRQSRANRVTPASSPRPLPQRPAESIEAPQQPAIGRPAEIHLHFHGVSAEDIAAAVRHAKGQVED
jgi:hypothetical protein